MVNKIFVNNNDSNYTHSIFDISEYTGNSYSTLSDALNAIPQAKHKGGMTIRYVSTNDDKYIQYRLMSENWDNTITNWQSENVDSEITYKSNNLTISDAVFTAMQRGMVFDYSNNNAPIGLIKDDGTISTSVSSYKLYSFPVTTQRNKTIYVNVHGLPDRESGWGCLRFIDDNGDYISGSCVPYNSSKSYPLVCYPVTVPANASKLQIASWSGKMSVYQEKLEYSTIRTGWNLIQPENNNHDIENLKVGSRYLGCLAQTGLVLTPSVLNTFYIAKLEGEYTFSDNTSFTLKKDSFVIFNFKDDGTIEKELIEENVVLNDEYDNLIDYSTIQTGKYINNGNGNVADTTAALAASDYISVIPGEKLIINYAPASWGAAYNSSKEFVGNILDTPNSGISNTTLTVPNNVAYIRMTVVMKDGKPATGLYRNSGAYFKVNPKDISTFKRIEGQKDERFAYYGTIVTGKYVNGQTKQIIDDATKKYIHITLPRRAKPLINILPDSIVYGYSADDIRGNIDVAYEFSMPNIYSYHLFLNYDIDTDLIGFVCYPVNVYEYTYTFKGLSNPEVNELVERVDNLEQEFETLVKFPNQWNNKKILWLGTSIPWGQTVIDGQTVRSQNPYPKQVCDALGATLIDSTMGGLAQMAEYDETAQMWCPKRYTGTLSSNGSTCLTAAECLAAYNAGLVSSNLSSLSYERTLINKNADLYIFDVEPNNSADGSADDLALFDWYLWKYADDSTFASHRNTYIGALIYEIDQLLTDKPDAKVVFIGEHSLMKSNNYNITYAIRELSKALCEKFHIHYINLAEKLFYVGKNKNEYLTSDMVHPTQAAYDRMAKMLIHELLLVA